MKFTKENVFGLFGQYRRNQSGMFRIGDLEKAIMDLDDTPEKVAVKKFVAEFYEGCENAPLSFLITQLEDSDYNEELGKWYRCCSGRHRNGRANAQEVIAKMHLYGYEVEKEPLYHVATKDGKLMLFKYENVVSVTPAPVVMTIKDYGHKPYYQLTESEIKSFDERYWPFAVPVND